ncbi:MAG: ABC transporter ATP-binding protein [Patescibacteria group bacterium]
MIEAKKIIKNYGHGNNVLHVLRGFNLQVDRGEFVAITGRSGSGKSTLLYQLGLLDQPTSGQIFIDGQETTNLSSQQHTRLRLTDLGYIFQDYALVPELTACDNVLVPLLMQGWPRSMAITAAQETLTRVGLAKRIDHLPSQLSGGEQQRVAIARALSHRPKILFADEPTANLDSDTAERVLDIFSHLNSDGQTIIMVTHEPEYAARAGRVITLSDGMIIE